MHNLKYAQKKIMYRTNGSGFDVEKILVSDYSPSSVWRYETDSKSRKRYDRISKAECGYNWFPTLTEALSSLLANAIARQEILQDNLDAEIKLVGILRVMTHKHNGRF